MCRLMKFEWKLAGYFLFLKIQLSVWFQVFQVKMIRNLERIKQTINWFELCGTLSGCTFLSSSHGCLIRWQRDLSWKMWSHSFRSAAGGSIWQFVNFPVHGRTLNDKRELSKYLFFERQRKRVERFHARYYLARELFLNVSRCKFALWKLKVALVEAVLDCYWNLICLQMHPVGGRVDYAARRDSSPVITSRNYKNEK